MASSTKITLHPAAASFELDDDVVVFAGHTGDLFLLNPTAGLIWRGLSDGLSPGEIADALASIADRRRDDVMRDCEALIAEWRHSGLLENGAPVTPEAPTGRESLVWWGDLKAKVGALNFRPILEKNYRIVDFSFRLRTADAPADRSVHQFLEHLQIPDGEGIRATLDLVAADGQWRLHHNGRLIDECSDLKGLMPMVHGNLMLAAYWGSECLVALHAAAVTADDQCVLLAGVPGSGKSTLTAALLASGFGYWADDTVLLTPAPVRVRSVPMRVGLKEGSWPVVSELWPELKDLEVHCRSDGKRIRYLLPESVAWPDGSRAARVASTLVFPCYQAGATTLLRPIRRAEALLKLAEAGYDVPSVISREVVATLVEWIAGLDCYELHYSDLDEAVQRIAGVAE